ncbi:MAG TPA: hypothetical protein VIK86_00240 [Candidatus Paceibacterota bacterium]
MIITNIVKTTWNNMTKEHYEGKGYIFTKFRRVFEVKVKDLPNSSTVKVKVACDCCLKEEDKEICFGTVYNNMIKNKGLYICRKCAMKESGKRRRKTHENFKKKVYNLVGDEYTVIGEYIKSHDKLLMRHNSMNCNNNEYPVTPDKFLSGRRCPECYGNIKRTFNDIVNKMKIVHPDIKVLSEFYKIAGDKDKRNTKFINCKCLNEGCDNEWSASEQSVISGCGCYKCGRIATSKKLRIELDDVKSELAKTNKNIIILNENYKEDENCKSYLNMKCLICNNEWESTADNLRSGRGCPKCAIKNNSGINAWNYNPNLTQEEREVRRSYIGDENYSHWRNSVFKRDDYTCQHCGARNGMGKAITLNAHHLNGYHWDKENRMNVDNGITLCKECHDEFHKRYKNKYNTKINIIQKHNTKNINT